MNEGYPERYVPLDPGGASLEMVWIEPGTFVMGLLSSEVGRYGDEGPVHEVTISKGFYLGNYEVTQGQFESVSGEFPGPLALPYVFICGCFVPFE